MSLPPGPAAARKDGGVSEVDAPTPPPLAGGVATDASIPGVTLRRIPGLAPRVTLKMAQVMRSKGLLRPDGHLRADDILTARALANLPGRAVSAELDAGVSRMLRAAVRRRELAPSTLLLVGGVRDYSARLAVNMSDPALVESLSTGSAVCLLPVGLWWEELKGRGLPAAAFDLPDPDPLEAVMSG